MKPSALLYLRLLLIVCVFGLSACGGKEISTDKDPYAGPPCMDVLSFPQNLNAYVAAAGGAKPLLPAAEQAGAAARQKEAWYRPWRQEKAARWIGRSLEKNFHMQADKGYTREHRPFSRELWNRLEENSNKTAYGKEAGPAVALRRTNLRAMPTGMHYYLRPDLPGEGYPFDYFQHSAIPPGTPLYICNLSRDGQWVLVDSPITAGWVPAQDIARVDAAFIERWQGRPLAALTRDGVSIGASKGDIGTLLPLVHEAGPGLSQALRVYYPIRGASGLAEMAEAALEANAATAVPLPLTAAAVAEIGKPMLGQAYGWGGLDGRRDCSALTRDLFVPFGLHLPRNSGNQGKAGSTIELGGLTNEEKEKRIMAEAPPFRSLIWFKGHIGVYLGIYEGKPMLFHNMWGLKTRDVKGGCDNRAVVGKGVITTLRPGAERPDLCRSGSFLDRIEKVAVLPR